MNILIVDVERLARNELKRLLADIDDIKIIGEAENIDKAKQLIESKDVDLLLLDISMPEGDGFQLLEGNARAIAWQLLTARCSGPPQHGPAVTFLRITTCAGHPRQREVF